MVGYAGTGYHGLQINHVDKNKTIEGDLFAAFVAAGAISKANAIDPRKSSLVRCARTDKGVHAAANLLSLKLIIEDEDIKDRINAHLPEQIRVWGIQRANNSFSAYQACDSRCYEYLLPSYALLPPHPSSFMGKQLVKAARETGTYEAMRQRMGDTTTIWDDIEENIVEPILSALPANEKEAVLRELRRSEEEKITLENIGDNPPDNSAKPPRSDTAGGEAGAANDGLPVETAKGATAHQSANLTPGEGCPVTETPADSPLVQEAIRKIKGTYLATKKGYRISRARIERFQEALNLYVGTNNFHNYTIRKSFKDRSAKRYIKSFVVNPKPILIGETEWLSLKVWGQSFMMHQIRKMVAMAVMILRCGSELSTIEKSYGEKCIGIPKAPSLGLLLERPLFDSYNSQAESRYNKPAIDFDKYEKEIQEFKDRQIYSRMWEEEERKNTYVMLRRFEIGSLVPQRTNQVLVIRFHLFFHQLDAFQTDYFAWATAYGIEKAKERAGTGSAALREVLGSEDENPEDGEG